MKIKKVKITPKPRKLSADWTVELQPGEIQYGDGFDNKLSIALKEEIDWEIKCEILLTQGWTIVKTPQISFKKHINLEMNQWIKDNCKGKFERRHGDYLFQYAEDAEWFALRWT